MQSQMLTLCYMNPLEKLTGLAMPVYITMGSQRLILPVRPVCPEAPVWPVEPLAPASSHNASHCVRCLSQCKALNICHDCIHPNSKLESTPTCETRLPRSPRLACGAAGPCKHSQRLTLCHMHHLLCAKL